MEFKEAVKALRVELDLTQNELAEALHITALTVGRWERGISLPNRAAVSLLMGFARVKGASGECLSSLKDTSSSISKRRSSAEKEKQELPFEKLFYEACVAIYVCDQNNGELLYLNRAAEELFAYSGGKRKGACYKELMQRSSPCEGCVYRSLSTTIPHSYTVTRLDGGAVLAMRAQLVEWNDRKLRVVYAHLCAD